ncbi:MAG: hypothetical protein R2747_07310 [Pyrinomonadaceae bacterium]
MKGEGSFLVEDFINAITTQLDRVQDALRLKAVNRPLTYALKDIALDLQVFVEVDAQGNVRFRSSAANETGASTLRLGFTTITRPMIEENTISLAMTQSPHLEDLGLAEDEKRRLEQVGVRNAAQLQELRNSTDTKTVSRLTGIPLERLRNALSLGKPKVDQVVPEKPPATVPPVKPVRPLPSPLPKNPPVALPPTKVPPVFVPPKTPAPVVVAPGVKRLSLLGNNLVGGQGLPEVRLNDVPLSITEAEHDYLTVEMPEEPESGALEIFLPDGEQVTYQLSFEPETPAADGGDQESIGRSRWEASGKEEDYWSSDPDY